MHTYTETDITLHKGLPSKQESETVKVAISGGAAAEALVPWKEEE